MAKKGDDAGFIARRAILMPGRAYVDYNNLAASRAIRSDKKGLSN